MSREPQPKPIPTLGPEALKMLTLRNTVAALQEALTRLDFAHRHTDSHSTARDISDATTMARRAFRQEDQALRDFLAQYATEEQQPT